MIRTAAVLAGTGGAAWVLAAGWVATRAAPPRAPVVPDVVRPALVLGCRPGPGLDRRVDGAVALWRAGRASRLVVSGAGEAAAGVARALAAGLPADALAAEDRARNTLENLRYSSALLDGAPFWIVSDDWHLPRALLLARRLGLQALPAPVRASGPRLRRYVREGLSVVRTVVEPIEGR